MGLGLMMVKRLMAFFGGVLRVSNTMKAGEDKAAGAVVELVFRTDRESPPLTKVRKGRE
jgi:nitrogen fixation/metabolism regulation signal transduction histidine kinase